MVDFSSFGSSYFPAMSEKSNAVEPAERSTDPLLTPYRLGDLTLRNRIVMAPMTRYFANDGILAPHAVTYYARRAKSVGLIISEGIAPCLIGAEEARVPNLQSKSAKEAWMRVVKGVHSAGGKIFAQLWHSGIRRNTSASAEPGTSSLGPSNCYPELRAAGATMPGRQRIGRAMTERDIRDTIDAFGISAKAALDCGFDGIELHGAHGYLLDQFFWSESNHREDRYGASFQDRLRLGVEIVQSVKAATHGKFPVSLRFSQWKLPDFYNVKMLETPQMLEEFLVPFVEAGVDVFHASTRRFWEPAFNENSLNLAGWAKKISGKTSVMVGSIGLGTPLDVATISDVSNAQNNVVDAAAMIRDGIVDLAAVGRALIADPDWAATLSEGTMRRGVAFSGDMLTNLN
jgi:2,4-dienoyl-CoA reductase-like NADH-dependent reductase (Old Yellow Enzyme family)